MQAAPSAIQDYRFPCEQCGADYRFAAGENVLKCDHCGHVRPILEHARGAVLKELDFRAALEANLPDAEIEETRVLRCPNCAAEVEFNEATHAKECPFCATPVVTDTGTNRHIKPKAVLPFQFDERAAKAAMNKWLGSLWFAPNGLKEYARKGRRMQGIYVPYWTYDAETSSRYSGQRGDDYYVTKKVMIDGEMRTRQERRTRWSARSGRVSRFFDDVLVLASASLPKRFTDALQPWDLSYLEPYLPEFLAGFRAEGYTVELKEGFTEARHYMDRIIERDVRFDIGGDRQRIHSIDTKLGAVTFKHILLPVWLAAYKYRGETYRFVVNGQTGRVQGERPYSVWKVTFAVIIGALIAGAVGYGIAMNQ